MSSFDCIGSAIAWYKGDIPELMDLMANFHMVRVGCSSRNQPSKFKTKEQLFEFLSPHYREPQELKYQLSIAEQAFNAGMMSFRDQKQSGCLSNSDYLAMKVLSIKADQLMDIDTYIPD